MRRTSKRTTAVVAAFVVGALIGGGPPLAAAVFDAVNADKVDGRHAVGAGASKSARAGKLVATNAAGQLPNDIIAKAPNSQRLGGRPASGYQRRITGTCPTGKYISAFGADGSVTCATDRINGGDAQFLDDDSPDDFMAAQDRTKVVRSVGTATQNGTSLRNAVAAIPDSGDTAPSASNPWVVQLEPGTFDIGTTALAIPDFVQLSGSGRTSVISAETVGPQIENHAVLILGDDTSLRRLRLQHAATGSGVSAALYIVGDRVSVVDVGVDLAVGPGTLIAYGVLAETGSSPVLVEDANVVVAGTGADTGPAIGVFFGGNVSGLLRDSTVVASWGAGEVNGEVTGVLIGGFSSPTTQRLPTILGSEITVSSGGDYARALWSQNGQTIVDSSTLRAVGSTAPASLFQEGGAGRIIRVVETLLAGPVVNTGSLSCVGAFNEALAALNPQCAP